MMDYLPLLIVGAIIGVLSGALILAYALVKDKKESMGFERNMKDGELMKRLLVYAKPYWLSVVVRFLQHFVADTYIRYRTHYSTKGRFQI